MTDSDANIASTSGSQSTLLAEIRSQLREDGPEVIVSAIIAYVDDERKQEDKERALTPERTAKVKNLIQTYRNWFDAYWRERVASDIADAAEAQPDGSPERERLSELLGGLLATDDGVATLTDRAEGNLLSDRIQNQPEFNDIKMKRKKRSLLIRYIALAAMLLIALGVLLVNQLQRGRLPNLENPAEMLAANASPLYDRQLGPDTEENIQPDDRGVYAIKKASYIIKIGSPREGYATIVQLSRGKRDIYPKSGQAEISVLAAPGTPQREPRGVAGPFDRPTTEMTLLIIVTGKPACQIVAQIMPTDGAEPGPIDDLIHRLRIALRGSGHEWAAVARFVVKPASTD